MTDSDREVACDHCYCTHEPGLQCCQRFERKWEEQQRQLEAWRPVVELSKALDAESMRFDEYIKSPGIKQIEAWTGYHDAHARWQDAVRALAGEGGKP